MPEPTRVTHIRLPGDGATWQVAGPDVQFHVDGIRRVGPDDRLLCEFLPRTAGRIIIPLTGNAPLVPAVAGAYNPGARVDVFEMDLHSVRIAQAKFAGMDQIRVVAGADIEASEHVQQTAILLIRPGSDRVLMFDMIERLCMVMPDASPVLVTVPTQRRRDLVGKLNKHLAKGHVVTHTHGVLVYAGRTRKDAHRWTPRISRFEAHTRSATVTLCTRPGVFAHGHVDTGGLALAESVDVDPSHRVLDLGCGCGLVGLLLGARMRACSGSAPGAVTMVDSHARAIACARDSIRENGLDFVEVQWADVYEGSPDSYDVVVGNPPYFAEHRIGEYFIDTARRVLEPTGRLYLVSKHGDAISHLAQRRGFGVDSARRRGYDITICHKPDARAT